MTPTTQSPVSGPATTDAVAAPAGTPGVFDAALAGRSQRLVRADGVVLPLATQRWQDDADGDDAWMVGRCAGPTLDLGCGPGRLVVALADHGVPALGVDVSVQAVQRCLDRGAAVLHRDAFERLPGEGRWEHVVLADGNIGIGGDPVGLLRRCRDLLVGGGTIIVELEPEAALWQGAAHLEGDASDEAEDGAEPVWVSGWFPWAVLGPAAVDDVAAQAGLVVTDRQVGERCFAELSIAA